MRQTFDPETWDKLDLDKDRRNAQKTEQLLRIPREPAPPTQDDLDQARSRL